MSLEDRLKKLSLSDQPGESVFELFQKGQSVTAAQKLSALGEHELAGDLYEQAFQFQEAFNAFRLGQAWKKLTQVTQFAQDGALDAQFLDCMIQHQLASSALEWLPEKAKRLQGPLLESLGRFTEAAALFEAIGRPLKAGVCHERDKAFHEAGRVYENALKSNPGDQELSFRLSRILMELGQFDEAINVLQPLLDQEDPLLRARVFPLVCICFLALGLEHAATTTLHRWREANCSEKPPETVSSLLRDPVAKYYLDRENRIHDEDSDLLLAGRYLLSSPLEANPYGETWLGYDRLTAQEIHLQIFENAILQSNGYQRLTDEILALARLDGEASTHRHEFNPRYGFLISTPPAGEPLQKKIRHMSYREVRRVFFRTVDVLAKRHDLGWHHGQLHPGNIYVGVRDIEIRGWGFRHLRGEMNTLTAGVESLWHFASPESLKSGTTDVRSDLYSLAALLKWIFSIFMPETAVLPESWALFFQKELADAPNNRSEHLQEFRQALPEWPLLQEGTEPRQSFSESEVPAATPKPVPQRLTVETDYRLDAIQHEQIGREEWRVTVNDRDVYDRLLPWSKIEVGAQEIFRWEPEQMSVYLSPTTEDNTDLDHLRAFPYGLTRDLAGVAHALLALHAAGLSLGFFGVERGLGNFGPQLQLVPGSLPQPTTAQRRVEDLEAFEQLLAFCFDLADEPAVPLWDSLLNWLLAQKAITSHQREQYGGAAPENLYDWHEALAELTRALKQKRSHHVLAKVTQTLQKETPA